MGPAEPRDTGDQGSGRCEGEGYERVVAGDGHGVEQESRHGKDYRRKWPPPAKEGAGSTRREHEGRYEDERHLRGEKGCEVLQIGGKEGRRHERQQASRWVLDKEVAIGYITSEDSFTGLSVGTYVQCILGVIWRQRRELPQKHQVQIGSEQAQ